MTASLYSAGVAEIEYTKLIVSQKLLLRLQRETWDSRQCVIVSESLRRRMYEVIPGRLKLQQKFEEVRNSRNIECLPKNSTGSNDSSGGKDHVCFN